MSASNLVHEHKRLLLSIISVTVACAFVAVFILANNAIATETDTTDYRASDGQKLADAYLRGVSTPTPTGGGASGQSGTSSSGVVTIDGHSVTASEYLSQKEIARISILRMRNALTRVVSDAEFSWNATPVPADISFNYGTYVLPESSGIRTLYQPRIDLYDKYGVNASALGALIYKYSLINAASGDGYAVTDTELSTQITTLRTLVSNNSDSMLTAYVQRVGEDVYWSNVTVHVKYQLLLEKWFSAIGDSKDQRIVAAVNSAQVSITDSTLVATTVANARNFIQESLNLLGVSPPLALEDPSDRTFTVQQTQIVSFTLPSATGGSGGYTYTHLNTLPAGLSLSGRTVSGTPTAAGTYTVTWRATDSGGSIVTQQFTVTVHERLTLPSIGNRTFVKDQQITPFTLPAATGGSGGYTYTDGGTLPAGLSVNLSSRTVSGTPTASGTHWVLWGVTSSDGVEAWESYYITVNNPPG